VWRAYRDLSLYHHQISFKWDMTATVMDQPCSSDTSNGQDLNLIKSKERGAPSSPVRQKLSGDNSGHRSSSKRHQMGQIIHGFSRFFTRITNLLLVFSKHVSILKKIVKRKRSKKSNSRTRTHLQKLINRTATKHFIKHESMISYLFWALNHPIQPCLLPRRRWSSLELSFANWNNPSLVSCFWEPQRVIDEEKMRAFGVKMSFWKNGKMRKVWDFLVMDSDFSALSCANPMIGSLYMIGIRSEPMRKGRKDIV
jgi:hypothetical protein